MINLENWINKQVTVTFRNGVTRKNNLVKKAVLKGKFCYFLISPGKDSLFFNRAGLSSLRQFCDDTYSWDYDILDIKETKANTETNQTKTQILQNEIQKTQEQLKKLQDQLDVIESKNKKIQKVIITFFTDDTCIDVRLSEHLPLMLDQENGEMVRSISLPTEIIKDQNEDSLKHKALESLRKIEDIYKDTVYMDESIPSTYLDVAIIRDALNHLPDSLV